MTEKQKQQFNLMRDALIQISKGYMTTKQMRKQSEKEYGLDFQECLEMAYENIQEGAKRIVKGIKQIN